MKFPHWAIRFWNDGNKNMIRLYKKDFWKRHYKKRMNRKADKESKEL